MIAAMSGFPETPETPSSSRARATWNIPKVTVVAPGGEV